MSDHYSPLTVEREREMADAAVDFLLNNVKDLLLYHSHLITGVQREIESLENDLRLFKAFLRDSQKRRRKDEHTNFMVRQIRNVVYDLEDAIDAFVAQAIQKRHTLAKFRKPRLNVDEFGKEVEKAKEKVKQVRMELSFLKVDDGDEDERLEVRPPIQKGMVGFVDVRDDLIHRLCEDTNYFDVTSLIGMFGLGKTKLAWEIFNYERIKYHFSVRIWLSISQKFSDKEIFLHILKEFTTIDDDTRQLDARQIADMAVGYLETRKFLIVLDDVWNPADWDRLRVAIPYANRHGKILLTSRNKEVGWHASMPRHPKQLRMFTEDESWELLRLEALGERDCPPELETIGRLIAQECGFLPLNIVIIGGILATIYSASDASSTIKRWEKVSQRVMRYINENDPGDRLRSLIHLSYDVLPYHLRACFLYLGIFPQDCEIPVSKLIRMWIGEGFIQQGEYRSLEETGEMYLEDLINRNLVTVDKLKPDGKIKTCRLHYTLRNFCQNEAREESENFHQEIKFEEGNFVPPIGDIHKYRRLSVHSHCLDFISQKPYGPRVRSFVCLPKDRYTLSAENTVYILKAFKLVRVLDIKPIKLAKLSSDVYQMVHARYISLSCNLALLPSKFSELWNIQTLIVETSTSRKLEVKADIWKLSHLRHFKTNVPATLPKPSKSSRHGAELQTLGAISVESCTAEILEQACNLKKLTICGRLALLLEGKVGSLETLGRMEFLEKLKLVNDAYPVPPSEGRLKSLPQPYQFPASLTSLTIVATYLDWKFMANLGFLERLQVLKLKYNAFTGNTWEAVGGGFQRLEFLEIEETDLCDWKASSHHDFPRLKGLVLKKCEKLSEIPMELADIPSFQRLDLLYCTSAVASAKRIQEAKIKLAEGSAFKLSIYPSY